MEGKELLQLNRIPFGPFERKVVQVQQYPTHAAS